MTSPRRNLHLYWSTDMEDDGYVRAFCSCMEWEVDAYVNLLHSRGPEVSEAKVRVDLRELHGMHLSERRKSHPEEFAPLHVEVVSADTSLTLRTEKPVEILVSQAGKELGRVWMDSDGEGGLRFEAWLRDNSEHSPVYGSCPEAVEWLVRKAGGSDE